MKANQKFQRSADDAVSPVIAVILMVAITVVLAATVYVWVSGFGAQSGNPQKSISLTSAGTLSSSNKTYAIASSTSGMKWSDVTLTVNGVTQTMDTSNSTACGTSVPLGLPTNTFAACSGGSYVSSAASVISAGDTITIEGASGATLRILDTQANAVMLTLTMG
ncbi:MAG: Archaeal Type pilin, N-terminal [Thermoplasmata archaeon]|jgi:flagellin-like protein|nr:Archaeal Type pilin, N-terminal [Thermoplasmata archaeon]